MPVDVGNIEYQSWTARWKLMRDTVAGEHDVKKAGETYLPKLSGHDSVRYNAYRLRASFVEYTGRTLDGLTGLLMRVDPIIEHPAGLQDVVDDIDMAGTSLRSLIDTIAEEVVSMGRCGILVDYTATEPADMTLGEVRRSGQRPFVTLYKPEAIIAWRTGRVGSGTGLVHLRLSETVTEPDPKDEFAVKNVHQIRVYDLVQGSVAVRVFRKADQSNTWEMVSQAVPVKSGAPLDRIPFYFFAPGTTGPEIIKPPLMPVASVNLSHYRTMADYRNGLHWTGVPTPVFIGTLVNPSGEPADVVSLGSESGICIAEGGDAKMLEFVGEGIEGGLGKSLDRDEKAMAVLGARLIAPDRKQAETAEAAAIHRAGENSVLASIANTISDQMTALLTFVAEWAGTPGACRVELSTDYTPETIDSATLTALIDAYIKGGISRRELFDALQKGEIIDREKTFEEHEADIADDPPPLGTMTTPPADDNEDDEDA